MSRIAFIFPGQGAQVCGMGQDFYEQTETGKKIFDKASGLLGFSMPELCFEKNDRLDITEYTQAAMVTAGIAMMRVLEEKGIKPDVAAGLSLGEYCAPEGNPDAGSSSCGRRSHGSHPGPGRSGH